MSPGRLMLAYIMSQLFSFVLLDVNALTVAGGRIEQIAPGKE